MSAESDRELEQMENLDKLRKLVQTILGSHLVLLAVLFVLILGAILAFVAVSGAYSPRRYQARLTLCYQPKQKGKIGQYDDKYVLMILNRQTTRLHFVAGGEEKDGKRQRVADNILIDTERKQQHNFSIQLFAPTEERAVELINEFAQTCIQEYTRERTADLRKWKKVLDDERQEIFQGSRKISEQIARMTMPLQVVSVDKDYESLRTQLGELQASRSRQKLALDQLNSRREQLEKELSAVSPAVLQNLPELKAFFADLKKLDEEIARAAELYTEANPKMIALQTRRDAVNRRLERFKKDKEIRSVDPQMLRVAETVDRELKALRTDLEAKSNEMRVLDEEIADCEKRFRMLTEYQPKLQNLMQQRQSLQESMKRLEESISEINYMLLMVQEDLFVNEKATSAVGNPPITKKKLAVCIFAALVFVSFLAAVTVLLEFFFGRVANAEELQIYKEFRYLGVLPATEEMFDSKEREKMAFNKIFHHFQTQGLHVIFTGALPGSRIINELFEFFEWSFAMAGHRMLVLDLVDAEVFDAEPDPDSETMIVTFSGGKGYLPLASKKFLSPSELELLKNDLQILKKDYDYLFIRHSVAMRRSILFLSQIAEFCDGALVAVGAGRTPRKSLRHLLAMQIKLKIPVMTVLTDQFVKKLNKDLNQEAES